MRAILFNLPDIIVLNDEIEKGDSAIVMRPDDKESYRLHENEHRHERDQQEFGAAHDRGAHGTARGDHRDEET